MMNEPPLDEVLDKVDCSFTLVTQTAKRARQIIQGADKLVDVRSQKPISIAIEEIRQGVVRYTRLKDRA